MFNILTIPENLRQMQNLEEKLWGTLQQLTSHDFKMFKWFLKQHVLEGVPGIPEAQLEQATRSDTVDLMVQRYQDSGAVKVTLEILRKIPRNDLVKDVENSKHSIDDLQNERERTKLKKTMEQMIQDRRRKIEEIQSSVVVSRNSAERHISDSERTFQNLLQDISTSWDRLAAKIEEKQQSKQQQADELIQELQREILQLTNTCMELEQPSAPAGSQGPLPSIPATRELEGVSVSPPTYRREVVSILKELEEKLSQQKKKVIGKAELLQAQEFYKDVTMDPDTANKFLVLSADGKQVHLGGVRQNLPETPRRFEKACNVLGRPGCSSGRFYFQVQVEGLVSWDVGVVRGSVRRTGSISASPENGFWTICLRDSSKYKAHGERLWPGQPPKKVGVFVDYEGGCVSFFDVDSADLIHQFTHCSFSEQLWPFFSPGCQRGPEGPRFLVICPVDHDL